MKNIEEWYKRFLREMKSKGLNLEDMPEEVSLSCLFIHQAALLASMQPKGELSREQIKELF